MSQRLRIGNVSDVQCCEGGYARTVITQELIEGHFLCSLRRWWCICQLGKPGLRGTIAFSSLTHGCCLELVAVFVRFSLQGQVRDQTESFFHED